MKSTPHGPEPRRSSTADHGGTENLKLEGLRNARVRVALNRLADALEGLGDFRMRISQPFVEEPPTLVVTAWGEGLAALTEEIRARVAEDGKLRYVWSWDEDVAGNGDVGLAAESVARVLNPRM
ncbi:hypothetical protein [Actinomadura atramentaria]|uniref:hypothetical protein n=1 Tax=Actinomadura atramentaria TaxID=1990 RepID=UPI0003A52662|nr:hypothetical protein [Actinomadura atramentaria]